MRLYLTITQRNLPREIFPLQSLLIRAARLTIETAARWRLPQRLELSLLLTDDQGMRALNKDYRGQDKTTDVLSFPLWDECTPLLPNNLALPLGDIAISLPRVIAQAKEYRHSIQREMVFLFIHGLLHLLGYDHEQGAAAKRCMFALQKQIIWQLSSKNAHRITSYRPRQGRIKRWKNRGKMRARPKRSYH